MGNDVERYRHLPEPVRPEDMVELIAADAAPDPNFGRDPDTEFLLRNAG
jgi:hypothetical protein